MFSETLREIRSELGYPSARAFYAFLGEHGNLGFNYSYYVRIEGGKTPPSPAVAGTLCQILKGTHSDRLALAFCETLFPRKKHLFRVFADAQSNAKSKARSKPGAKPDTAAAETARSPEDRLAQSSKQMELSEAQVATIARSRLHYFTFILLTLAREPVPLRKLEHSLGQDLTQVLKELRKLRVIYVENEGIVPASTEMRFPQASTRTLKEHYETLDLWDLEMGKLAAFKPLLKKLLVRRVSPRYIGLIYKQSELLLELVRSSEELQTVYNNKVLVLNLSLSEGELPG